MSIASLRRTTNAGLLSLGVALMAGCGAESATAPAVDAPSLGLIPGGTGALSLTGNSLVGEIFKVCKVYSGADGGPVSVQVQVDVGNNASVDHTFNVNVANGECWEVWSTDGNGGVTDLVTVTETVPGGYTASHVKLTDGDGGPTNSGTVASATASSTITNPSGSGVDAVVVTFTNTEIVENGCTFTQGYWKNHAGTGPQADAWPALPGGVMALGTVNYTKAQLLSIFNTAPKGNGLISLARQLIAANLNILNGASATDISATITAANTLIGALVVPPVGSGFLAPSATSALTQALEQYNEGATGPGHCDELEPLDD